MFGPVLIEEGNVTVTILTAVFEQPFSSVTE
jgi:hypothetical protein